MSIVASLYPRLSPARLADAEEQFRAMRAVVNERNGMPLEATMGTFTGATSASPPETFDCKDAAIEYARLHIDLDVVRGYVVLPGGFTEHWWCRSRRGDVVDVTMLAGCVFTYVPLAERAPTRVSYCDSMLGSCRFVSPCEWCELRMKLERDGHVRVSVAPGYTPRAIIDRLLARNDALMRELATARRDRDRYAEQYALALKDPIKARWQEQKSIEESARVADTLLRRRW